MTRYVLIYLDISGPVNNAFDLLDNIVRVDPRLVGCQIILDDASWDEEVKLDDEGNYDFENGSCSGFVKMLESQIDDFFRIGRENGYKFHEEMRFYSSSPIEIDLSHKGGDETR